MRVHVVDGCSTSVPHPKAASKAPKKNYCNKAEQPRNAAATVG